MTSALQELQSYIGEVLSTTASKLADAEDLIFGVSSSAESSAETTTDDHEDYYNSNGDESFEDDFFNPLDGIKESIKQDVFSQHVGPKNFFEHIAAFTSAINWTEPFILAILMFHVIIIASTIWARYNKNMVGQMTIIGLITILVYFSETLNFWGSSNWEEFATQNYFDPHGFFMVTMVGTPLLLVFIGIMFSFTREARSLLTELQTLKLKEKVKQSRKKKSE